MLAKLRSGEPLNTKDKLLHEQGLVGVLRTLHDQLDAAVLQAYGCGGPGGAGWPSTRRPLPRRAPRRSRRCSTAVALNAKRAAEEAAGTVRWLRPDFQRRAAGGTQTAIDTGDGDEPEAAAPPPAAAPPKRAWPSGLPEQIKAIAEVLAALPRPMGLAEWKRASPRAGAGASGCR